MPKLIIKVRAHSPYFNHILTFPYSEPWIILLFCVLCTIIAQLSLEQCRLFNLHAGFPAIVTNFGDNVAKIFKSALKWNQIFCGYYLIHNVVKAELDSLKNHASKTAPACSDRLQEALDRSVFSQYCWINL